MTGPKISRREFIKISSLGSAGLLIAVSLPGCSDGPILIDPTFTPSPIEDQESFLFQPGIYATIDNQGIVTFTSFRSEMGQGSRTALAMVFADELEVPWSAVRIEQAPADSAYGNQVTGGSASISDYFLPVRQAGAAARSMLAAAAAQIWDVPAEECTPNQGAILHPDGQTTLPYGELVEAAAKQEVPRASRLTLKDPQQFKIIGTDLGHYDTLQMVTGQARYASDIVLPGMVYAVIARCPVFGGQVASFDDTAVRQVPGVIDVFESDGKVAVVAEHTWAAIQGRAALEITWEEGGNAGLSTNDLQQSLQDRLRAAEHDPEHGSFELDYPIPFQAHATMEPMNCIADVGPDSCQIWAPSQNPQDAQRTARSLTRLPVEQITVHVPLIGGGFGRRLNSDFVEEAVALSIHLGKPVKLFWTREDDLQHDFYHPISLNRASGTADRPDRVRVRVNEISNRIPTGAWRSVGNFTEAFPRECLIDELAAHLGIDALEIRRQTLSGRALAVVELAAEKAGWGSSLPAGQGRGLAYYATFGVTHVCHIVEVSVDQTMNIQVNRVVSAVDCGLAVNPDNIKAQIEGGIVFALTAVLNAQITLKDGRVEQSNFHDYPILNISQMPEVEVHIVASTAEPTGIGEMGVPPLAPAVANAIFAATGKRIRHLPITRADLLD